MPYKDTAVRKKMQRHYSRKWYLRNRAEHIKKSWKQKDKIRLLWSEYKAKQSCSHCGIQHPAVIDFHHVVKEGKKSVNKLIVKHNNYKAAVLEAETKCIPLCANCHRILHWKETWRCVKKRRKKRV